MQKNESPSSAGLPRREFIKKTATVAAAAAASTSLFKTPVYGANQAPSTGRVSGANDRITVAVIGVIVVAAPSLLTSVKTAVCNAVATIPHMSSLSC